MRRVLLALALAGCAPDEEDLEARLLEQAQEIRRLRQLNESLREAPDPPKGPAVAPIPGPDIPVEGVVIAIARDYGFLLAALDTPGAADAVKLGHVFAVMRGETRLARGEVIKLLKEGVPKIQIRASNPADLAAVKIGDRVTPVREVPVREPDGAQVTGVAGKGLFIVNRGRRHDLREGDRAFIYKNGALVGTLRLEVVETDSSVGRAEQGSAAIEIGHEVRFGEPSLRSIIGKIAYSDREIIVNLGTRHGARPKQRYEVRREGRKTGVLEIVDSLLDHSTAEPVAGTRKEDLSKGDIVELIRD